MQGFISGNHSNSMWFIISSLSNFSSHVSDVVFVIYLPCKKKVLPTHGGWGVSAVCLSFLYFFLQCQGMYFYVFLYFSPVSRYFFYHMFDVFPPQSRYTCVLFIVLEDSKSRYVCVLLSIVLQCQGVYSSVLQFVVCRPSTGDGGRPSQSRDS